VPLLSQFTASSYRRALLAASLFSGLTCFDPLSGYALDSKSPEVVAIIEKAKTFLLSNPGSTAGQMALAGFTLLKAGVKPDDPVIQRVLSKVVAEKEPPMTRDYELCVYLMFLAKLDAQKHRAEIDRFLQSLLSLQQPYGGWTYTSSFRGDTSQTQYAILALWELEHAGVPTPDQAWINAANWYMRTQAPDGGFGYQPTDPGPGNPLMAQQNVRNSLSAGGMGSLYICRDHFKTEPAETEETAEEGSGLPSAFRPVQQIEKEKKRERPRWDGVDSKAMMSTLDRGNQWMESNYKIDLPEYRYYHLYALERYHSFREFVEGREAESAAWYDDGARYLMQKQDPRGAFTGDHNGDVADTCFAVLFLLRSSKTVLDEIRVALGAGQLIGGHGLPKNTAEITERAGRIRAKPLKGPAEEMLKVLEDPDNPDHARAIEGVGEFAAEADDSTLTKHVAALRKVVAGKSPEARAMALRALARTRDLDQVPTLILALSDPDERVVAEAHQGLRFISRKLGSIGSEPPPAGPERRAAIKGWKAWYLAIRPNAEFEE
jgi:hypothetical protein